MSLLEIENLSLTIGDTPILKEIELSVAPGEIMGLVGESGSGKSMTALTVMRLLPHAARATGRVTFDGIDILAATEDQMCALRGDDIGMVFQEPMTALNPVKTIGEQVAEGIRWHTRASRADAEERARKMLDRVGLPSAKFPLSRYPHELSGGQRQRVVIAIACALKPKLLIADEPTTALDVVLQAQILDLLRDLVAENRMGLLLISHDLAVVTEMADRITILRHGEVMEAGDTARTLSGQLHPYTRQLAQASMHVPARAKPHLVGTDQPLLQVEGITRDYPGRRTSLFRRAPAIRAVDDVSLSMAPGQSVALVGRSGCGKSTLARMILALDRPSSGAIRFRGEAITGKSEAELKPARRDMQVVFQDPYGSFDPRQKVEKLVAEPLHVLEKKPTRAESREMVAHALHEVGLDQRDMDKYPHEFSGGQRQRLSIARAIITRPKLVVADEPVSALDVSIRAQILDLFAGLNQKLGIAYLFITHDLTVARAITDEVLVMHEGKIVERGKTNDVLDHPQSEAARALVAAAPDLHRAIAKRMQEQG
ncbi:MULTISPECIES: dipeptide ABC transporter ATP-binding protein [unclassified Mesorhizobium]|uniref:ABC transporter ATP-binding protein n=1 Tax=unclassified Mesorhizobium TaxID=325217 RepID=UPI000FD6C632|nr:MULTISPECIES: dipeptide ABC transporter ATP-binding protein [unclassified Mesorhizobium]TGR38805.1 ABC transporter ATP-binding protein [bacterium M00.F.Ca.ET.199.01.1.1]TGU27416.1 ABC transporter ATP-binding protein [bacterium M00.F.Ca.ET.156.01.1.1]TGV83840.1 ABC transporter ATP-binding protein [Mesorhizobium sp. M00.F.Ca.ET.149.01.1.1]TGR20530.1 ABC transporter ATP-binding protein [Mesorhizobium sp. M8A.F.Ca.ET.202.01.1.1]TGR22568.1 ABC transporter ATP-binding protein [Mesorhizobium sp. M